MTVGEATPVSVGKWTAERGGAASPEAPPAPDDGARRSRRRVIALMVALVVVPTFGAYVFASFGAERYGARVELLYDTSQSDSEQQADMVLSTQIALAESRDVLSRAAADVDMAVRDVERNVKASVVTGSEVLHITASAPTRARAQALAAAVAARYLDATNDAPAPSAAALKLLRGQISELSATRERQQQELATLVSVRLAQPGGGSATTEERALEESIAVLADRIDQFETRATEIELQDAGRERARVVSPAYALPSRIAPQPARAAAMGAVAGLALAALVAFVVSSRRRRDDAGVAASR